MRLHPFLAQRFHSTIAWHSARRLVFLAVLLCSRPAFCEEIQATKAGDPSEAPRLIQLARANDLDGVRQGLSAGEPAHQVWHGQTALAWACANNNEEMVRLLLSRGALVNYETPQTPLGITNEPKIADQLVRASITESTPKSSATPSVGMTNRRAPTTNELTTTVRGILRTHGACGTPTVTDFATADSLRVQITYVALEDASRYTLHVEALMELVSGGGRYVMGTKGRQDFYFVVARNKNGQWEGKPVCAK
jgi:hypothetical protein